MFVSGSFAFRSPHLIPCFVLLLSLCFRLSTDSPIRLGLPHQAGISSLRPELLIPLFIHKETYGSLKFPGHPHDCMPCSKTPVVSCILTLPGLHSLHNVSKTSAFRPLHNVGFPLPLQKGYHLTTNIPFSGFNHTACNLDSSGFGLPLPVLPSDFTSGLSARL